AADKPLDGYRRRICEAGAPPRFCLLRRDRSGNWRRPDVVATAVEARAVLLAAVVCAVREPRNARDFGMARRADERRFSADRKGGRRAGGAHDCGARLGLADLPRWTAGG